MLKLVLTVLTVALATAPAAFAGGPAMTIGATEDIVKQPDLVAAKAQMDLLKLAGLRGVRMTQEWAPGQTEPGGTGFDALENAVTAAQLDGVQVILSVTNHGSRTTPLSDQDQADFATYAANVARALPYVRDYVVGNEPNLNRYWLPQFGLDGSDVAAPAYESLLAKTYDALKAVSPKITVLGGAVSPRGIDRPNTGRDTHSPTAFITDMGAAYKASGRAKPIMDEFAFHPYGDNSSQPPAFQHPSSTSIGLGDYGKLVALLGSAFDGTAQAGSALPIVYDEYGVETQIPEAKASFYSGNEPTTTKPVDPATQGAYYAQAIALTFCQPNVRGLFLFHSVDETDLDRWQSGLYYADETPKASLAPTRTAVLAARRGIVARCPGLQLPVKAKLDRTSARNPRFSFRLSCEIDCTYRARLEKLPGHSTTMVTRGQAVGGKPLRITFPTRRLGPGRYRFTVRVVAPVNPGPSRSLFSAAFRIL
jgi:hypothetical protein